jgi:hypothetical protein
MKRTLILFQVALTALLWCGGLSPAIFFGEHRPGQPVGQHPDWPKGLGDLLTRGGRVYGSNFGWLGGDEDCFYFSGDAEDFNWFLERWAQLKGVSPVLSLHPGQEQATSIITKQPVAWFDWKVTIMAHWAESGRNLDIRLELWLGGEVELGKLKIPPGVTLSPSGSGEGFREIEKFIAQHNAKLKNGEEKEEAR